AATPRWSAPISARSLCTRHSTAGLSIDLHQMCERAPGVPLASRRVALARRAGRESSASKGQQMKTRFGIACLAVVVTSNAAIADTLADCRQGRNSDIRL